MDKSHRAQRYGPRLGGAQHGQHRIRLGGRWRMAVVGEGAVVIQGQEILAASIAVGTSARVLGKKIEEAYKAK